MSPRLDLAIPFVPTATFLQELTERARRYGEDRQAYTAVAEFVRHLHGQAGLPVPELEPYDPDPATVDWPDDDPSVPS